jgi:hypothetical protein
MNMTNDIKQNFAEMCKHIFIGANGFSFPFESIEHDPTFDNLLESKEYSLLIEKMTNLLVLINSDNSILEMDLETEIWEMI